MLRHNYRDLSRPSDWQAGSVYKNVFSSGGTGRSVTVQLNGTRRDCWTQVKRRREIPPACIQSYRTRSLMTSVVAEYTDDGWTDIRHVHVDLGARAEAAKVQPKNVWAKAEPKFSWAEAGKCLSQPSRAGKILTL